MQQKKILCIILLLIMSLIWGFAFVAQSKAADILGPFTFNAARNILAAITTFIILIVFKKLNKNKNKQQLTSTKKTNVILAGFFTGAMLFAAASFQQFGIKYTTAGKSGFITSLYIIIIPLFTLFLGKKIKPIIWISIFTSIIGFYLLSISGQINLNIGDGLTLLAALCFSFQILFVEYYSTRVDLLKFALWEFITAGLLSLVCALVFEKISLTNLNTCLIPILYTGIVSSAIGYSIQIYAQRHVNSTVASLIMGSEAAFAAIAGLLLLNETLSARETAGCIIIMCSIVMSQVNVEKITKKIKDYRISKFRPKRKF